MTSPTPPPSAPDADTEAATGRHRQIASRGVLAGVLAVTFVLGLVIGGAVIATTGFATSTSEPVTADTPDLPASPVPTPSALPTRAAGAQIAVDQSCVTALREAEDGFAAIQRAVQAVRQLDAARLDDIVNQVRVLQEQFRGDAGDCHATVALPTPSVTATPF